MGSDFHFSNAAFVFENGFDPKNPECAENGEGCGDFMTACFDWSMSGSFQMA